MKIFNTFALLGAAVAQDERALSLNGRIDNAKDKCAYFMEKAMFCEPPIGKKGKYGFRLNKVMMDAVHHVKIGKCDPEMPDSPYRRRRDAETDALDAEFEAAKQDLEDAFAEKGQGGSAAPKPQVVDRLEGICRKYLATVWNAAEVQDCKKLGAWEARTQGLLDHMSAMKNVCRNQDSKQEMGGGNYGAKPTKAPTKAPTTAKPKPTKKPYGGGKKPKKPYKG